MIVIMPAAEAARTPMWRILKREAERRGHAQQPRRLQERIGLGLVAFAIVVRHDMVEATGHAVGLEMAADGRPRRRRGDGPRQAERVEQVEQFQHAGLHRQVGLDQLVEDAPATARSSSTAKVGP